MSKKNKSSQSLMPDEVVMSKIYIVRDQRVMLDRDLAYLYDVKAYRLREQVKRNENKFPDHFMFQLSEEEAEIMVSQNAIPSKQHLGGALPYVFTEHGVLQLANVLRSERATEMSIKIIEVFVKMREILFSHKDLLLELEEVRKKISGHDEEIALIFEYIKQFEQIKREELEYKNRKPIGYKPKKKD